MHQHRSRGLAGHGLCSSEPCIHFLGGLLCLTLQLGALEDRIAGFDRVIRQRVGQQSTHTRNARQGVLEPLIVSEILWNLSWVVCLAGLIFPPLVRPVYVAMMAVALPIGFVVSTILMVIIYYLILTPIGLAMRLFGYDPMRMRPAAGSGSFWIERPTKSDVSRYFKQY